MTIEKDESTVLTDLLHRQRDTSNEDNALLYSLSDMRSHRAWDHSWPTLTEPRRFTERQSYVSDEPFFETLRHHNHGVSYGLLKAVGAVESHDTNHVVLYGGALVDIVLNRDHLINDWDLRLIGSQYVKSEEDCIAAAKAFVRDVFQWLKAENNRISIRNASESRDEHLFKIQDVVASRYKSTVTIAIPGRNAMQYLIASTKLQFTFQPYESVQGMFRDSLPHCTRIAILNDTVVMDELARYTLESVCLVLDPADLLHASIGGVEGTPDESAASLATEMNRVIKYYYKGFDVILPDLDIAKLPRRLLKFDRVEVLDLPALTVLFNRLDGNKIMVTDLAIPDEFSELNQTSTTGQAGYDATEEVSVGTSIHANIKRIIAGELSQFSFVAEGERTDSIFDVCPLLTPRMIGKAYETVESRLTEPAIPMQTILDYFGLGVLPEEVATKLIVNPMQANRRLFQFDRSSLSEFIAREKEALLDEIAQLPAVMKERGRDTLLQSFAHNVSSEGQIRQAIYGSMARDRQSD